MTEGSGWYYKHWEGLIDAKHVDAMGMAIWLYEFILSRASAADKDGLMTYSHLEAAQVLGRTDRTIKTWFKQLQEQGYIETRARKPYHLEVQVTKWRTFEEWRGARQVKRTKGEVKDSSSLSERSEERSEGRSEESRTHTITIKLSSYCYPSGSGEPSRHSLADAFRELLEHLKTAPNKAAVLAEIYRLCFGNAAVPAYGYLGKTAKEVGGAGRLAELMWLATAKPPTGDVLAYLRNTAKGQGRRNGKGGTPAIDTDPESWLAEAERVRAQRGD